MTPIAVSTASRSSASRWTRQISGRAVRRDWVPASSGGCGMPATGCARIANRRSRESILPRPCSTCWHGEQIRCRSTGSKRRLPIAFTPALRLLHRLGAIDGDGGGARITALGRQLQRVPLHPRLARILIDGRGAPEAAAACATLSMGATGAMGAMGAMGASGATGAAVRQIAQELQRIASNALGGDVAAHITDESLRHALFTGYADRLAKRRPGFHDRFLLASGHGAALAREAADVDGDYIVALDVVAAEREGISESRIRCGQPGRARVDSADVDRQSSTGSTRRAAARVRRASSATMPSCSAKRRYPSTPWRPRHSSPRRGSRASTTPRRRSSFDVCDLPASTSTCARSSVRLQRRRGRVERDRSRSASSISI